MSAALPQDGTLLAVIRTSCVQATQETRIAINDGAIDTFLRTLNTATYDALKSQHGLAFPLRFDTWKDEINFLAVLSLLNAFSGYRADFHSVTGSGASDNVRRMLLGMYLSGNDSPPSLSAEGLAKVSTVQLASAMGVPTHTEEKHPTLPFVTVGTAGGPLAAPLDRASKMCNEAGQFLEREGKRDLGTYLLDEASAALALGRGVESRILEAIACVPGFDDATEIEGRPVYIMKKALYLLNALRDRAVHAPDDAPQIAKDLGARWANGFPAPLPMFVDNVIPTMLLHFKILDVRHAALPTLSASVGEHSSAQATLELGTDEAYRIRAAALTAGAKIVEHARANAIGMTEVELDGYLWSIAKEGELRKLSRIAVRDTEMF